MDETTMFLYNIENYFLVGVNHQLDRDIISADRQAFSFEKDERFKVSNPVRSQTNEIEYVEKDIACTQIVKTSELTQTSKGILVMRLHFLVSGYLNLYIWDPVKKEVVLGSSVMNLGRQRGNQDKKSHLFVVDKLLAEMNIGDTFLEQEEKI